MALHDPAPKWDVEVDVVVVGSGAGALTTALAAAGRGADVLVVEKSELYGGTSATSGGGVWIPASRGAASLGMADTPERAFEYMRGLIELEVPDDRIWAYATGAREMLEWMEEHSELKLNPQRYTDYHPERSGAVLAGRTHEPSPLDGRLLGDDLRYLRPPHPATALMGRISLTMGESGRLLTKRRGWFGVAVKVLGSYALDLGQRIHTRRDRRLTLGNALVGRLKLSLDRAGVALWRETPLVDLIQEDGRVIGIVATRNGVAIRIRAAKGVMLAAGGFERNSDLREKYLDGPAGADWSGSQLCNTGDAIMAGWRIGAALGNMDSAWWAVSLKLPDEDRARILPFERGLPGSIIVNQAGERYMNEAASYHVAGRAMLDADRPGAGTAPSFFVFDARYRANYPIGPMLPGLPAPSGMRKQLVRARSWAGLAEKIGVPPEALATTVGRFNAACADGVDRDFGRGESAFDRFCGDVRVKPNPTMRALDKPPFYAVPVWPGDIGTNGGLLTDDRARVLDIQGRVIAGLYACGNASASAMGHSYPGAGTTLGPAMTFGYLAALDMTGSNK